MNRFSDQRGFAMLEVMIGVAVVSFLAMIVVPKVSRALDTAYVDYEIRCLHSLMHYTQSCARLCNYKSYTFETLTNYPLNTIELFTDAGEGEHASSVRRYGNNMPTIFLKEPRFLERDYKFSFNNYADRQFKFDSDGVFSPNKSGHIALKKHGVDSEVSRFLVLQGYGRIRIDRESQ